ncbi:MAG: hypothetical protein Q7K47_00400 [Fusobacterium sp. JB019]|nr:hypothetical protein [Fusobacterium sp. JB019]
MKMSIASIIVTVLGLVFAVLGFMSNDRKKRILAGLILLFLAMGIGKDLGWWLN